MLNCGATGNSITISTGFREAGRDRCDWKEGDAGIGVMVFWWILKRGAGLWMGVSGGDDDSSCVSSTTTNKAEQVAMPTSFSAAMLYLPASKQFFFFYVYLFIYFFFIILLMNFILERL